MKTGSVDAAGARSFQKKLLLSRRLHIYGTKPKFPIFAVVRSWFNTAMAKSFYQIPEAESRKEEIIEAVCDVNYEKKPERFMGAKLMTQP